MSSHEKCYSHYQRQVIRKLAELLGDDAFSYERSANNHLQIRVAGIDRVFFTSSTPSDHRSFDNFISDIRSAKRQQEAEAQQQNDNRPPPASVRMSRAKKAVQQFMQQLPERILKDLKNRLTIVKAQEQAAVTAAESEARGDAMRNFRKTLIRNEIEQALSARDEQHFVPPGLVKSTHKAIEEKLNYMLPTVAEYQSLILAQEKLARQSDKACQPEKEEYKASEKGDDADQAVTSGHGAATEPVKDPEPSAKADSPAKQPETTPQTETPSQIKEEGASLFSGASQTASELLHLVNKKPHKRLAVLKKLSKQQLSVLMEDCSRALEEKHEEDVRQLAQQIKDKGVSLTELAALLDG